MKNFIILSALLSAAPAFAQPPVVSCQTFSNNLNFNGQSLLDSQARADAIQQCTANSQTNNADCTSNVACDDSAANPILDCTTFSKGQNFDIQGRDTNEASQRAIQVCQASSLTSNADCSANVSCTNGSTPPPPVQQCSTFSNGLNFVVPGLNPSEASQAAIQQCQASSQSNNADCTANVSCGNPPTVLACTTFSNGQNFEIDGLDQSESSQRAVQVCQTSSTTNNADCSANVSCVVQSSGQPQPPINYPAPQPPVNYPAPQPPINYPAPQPRPQPPVNFQVGQLCVVISGDDAYGQQVFNVMLNDGAILGTFSNTQDATHFAQQNNRCYYASQPQPQPQPPFNPGPRPLPQPQPPYNPGPRPIPQPQPPHQQPPVNNPGPQPQPPHQQPPVNNPGPQPQPPHQQPTPVPTPVPAPRPQPPVSNPAPQPQPPHQQPTPVPTPVPAPRPQPPVTTPAPRPISPIRPGGPISPAGPVNPVGPVEPGNGLHTGR